MKDSGERCHVYWSSIFVRGIFISTHDSASFKQCLQILNTSFKDIKSAWWSGQYYSAWINFFLKADNEYNVLWTSKV